MFATIQEQVVQGVQKLGPYVLVELFLPGGTLIALLLWLYRQYSKSTTANR